MDWDELFDNIVDIWLDVAIGEMVDERQVEIKLEAETHPLENA